MQFIENKIVNNVKHHSHLTHFLNWISSKLLENLVSKLSWANTGVIGEG